MKKLNCILFIQDNILEEKILHRIHSFDSIEVIDIIKYAIEFVEKLNRIRPDLLFIDVDMVYIQPFEIIKLIPKPPFTFAITSRKEIVRDLIDNGFFDYINPKAEVDFFCKKMSKLLNITHYLWNQPNIHVSEPPNSYKGSKLGIKLKNYTFIKYKKTNMKLIFDDIMYIKNTGNCLRIESCSGKIYYHNSTLKRFLATLPNDKFVRINKSIIVNYHRIEKFEKNVVYLKNQPFNVSRIYTMNLKDMFRRIV